MSNLLVLTTASGCHFQSKPSCGYPAPTIEDFFFKPIFSIGGFQFTKPILLMLLSAAIVLAVFWMAFRKPKLVPRGHAKRWRAGHPGRPRPDPAAAAGQQGATGTCRSWCRLFFFIWLMNLWELIPVAQFPATSKFAFPVGLTLVVWVTYMFIGMKHQGPIGYFKNMAVPPGAPWWILPLLSPIELLSNIIVRPFTLSIRLMANMLSGHLLLLVFSHCLLVPVQRDDRPAVRCGVVHRVPAGVRPGGADHAAAGLHIHDADRVLHIGCAGASALSNR